MGCPKWNPQAPRSEWIEIGEVRQIRYYRDGMEWVHDFPVPVALLGTNRSLVIRGDFAVDEEGFIHEDEA